MVAALACGGPPAPEGPGTEPTDTTEQTRRAGPKPVAHQAPPPAQRRTNLGTPTPDGGNGSELPPQYDFDLIPPCGGPARGRKTSAPIKKFGGVAQNDLLTTYGLPTCTYRGRWRYEFRAEPCPTFVDTLELKLANGVVRDQKAYRRPTGITCSKPPSSKPASSPRR
jgi:hypothetical protein